MHSEYAFRALAKRFAADPICDVGAFDGAHSKRFRSIGARVIAFEPNPHCFDALAADGSIAEVGIEIVNKAVWNEDGTVAFHVISLSIAGPLSARTPISSVLERMPAYGFPAERTDVEAVRLDTYLKGLHATGAGPIAVWIDAEGSGYQVIEGMEQVRQSVCLVHVEVETEQYWLHQRLGSDVAEITRRFGFTPVARSPGNFQFDVLFVNDDWLRRERLYVRWFIALAWCRLKVGQIIAHRARRARARPR